MDVRNENGKGTQQEFVEHETHLVGLTSMMMMVVLGALANGNMAKHDLNAFVDSCHSIVDMGRSSLS